MASEKRLIDANAFGIPKGFFDDGINVPKILDLVAKQPTVDAVEMPDKELLKAVKLLIEQYEHSKRSDYVHNPIAHAFYHTWKQLDESGYGERRDGNA